VTTRFRHASATDVAAQLLRQLPAGLCNMARRQMSLDAAAALKSKYWLPIFRESSKAAMSEGGAKGSEKSPKAPPKPAGQVLAMC
jgi:hypothetical protein